MPSLRNCRLRIQPDSTKQKIPTFNMLSLQSKKSMQGMEIRILVISLSIYWWIEASKNNADILQIVLNEFLITAPKLTNYQLAVLSIIFLFRHTQNFRVGNHQTLGEYFDNHVLPFADNLSKSPSCYQHLEYSGCGSVGIGEVALEAILGNTYQGLFFKGFDANEFTQKEISVGLDQRFFIPCLNDPTKIQVRATNKETSRTTFGCSICNARRQSQNKTTI